MKILGSDIRVGNIIEYKNDLWKCLKNQTSNRGNLRDSENFEQISINKTIVEECEKLLKENLEVTIEFYQEKPLSVILPRSIEYEIIETESVVKGQTASGSFKPATIQNGVKIMVPPFISQGDKIIVDTETQEYLKKVS
ncbi:MAG: elongation factor P [Candidatus Fonsibacter lacus]|nr:elongation factor P [Candidatus Fonsibacter lacus]